ncbi:hypothetical protein GCM10011519_20950 [Marmoricola endophyticus]|uniref:VOC domain-containing protein n=1 Tax=Marmoricola endophyticus TaxID=2040280 RepID=A0A917BJS8_9ACTN|nr:hypothetical protein [Marmoricola endophyticus]GGF46761.1 hypothetical protein GCM10011519_20950 [Marmoricola endophyticus]
MLTTLVPTVHYRDVAVGVDLFVDGVGMQVLHRDDDLVVVARDGVKLMLVPGPVGPTDERPELGIETDDIEAVHREISERRPDLLHPNLAEITARPWGAREFAILDSTTVAVVFREWPRPTP